MDTLSLLDVLVGYFESDKDEAVNIDDTYFEQFSEAEKLKRSIVNNLSMILKTRQGSVAHLPDFGAPNIMEEYFGAGQTSEFIKKEICETILQYEPRLAAVKIIESNFDQTNMRISLKIKVTIKEPEAHEILVTEFSPTGWTKVVFEKDA